MVMRQQTSGYEYMEDVKANVLQKFPLLGVTMSKLDTKPTEGAMAQIIDTAATNGKTVYFNPEFFQSLNEDQRAFIYAHEVMHVAFNHIMRSKGKQPKLWNTATDAVINQILKKEGYEIVGEGVDMPEALNHSAEEMYDKLLAQQNQNNQQNQDNNPNQQSGDNNQNNQGEGQNEPSQSGNNQNQKNKPKETPQDDQSVAQNNQEQKQKDAQNGEKNEAKKADSKNQEAQNNNENQPEEAQNRQGGKENNEQNPQQEQDGQSNADNTSFAEQNQNKQRSSSAQNDQLQTPPQNIEADLTDEESSIQHGHGLWEQAIEEAEKEAAKRDEAEAKQSLFERIKGIFKPDNQQKNDKHPESEEQNLEGDFLAKNRRLRHKKQQEVKQKISEHKKEVLDAIGKISTDMPQHRNLGESQQVADWKKILKQNMLDPEDKWSYRRSGADNDYMARSEELEDEVKAKTEVMIDVSGSVDEELVKEFLRQLKPLLKRSDIMVGCFDDEFYDFKEIKTQKDIDNFRIPGGGGTDLDLAVRSFSDDRDTNKIVFTDGEGEMPAPDLKNVKNLFWVVYQNATPSWYYSDRQPHEDWFKPVCGKVIYVERKEISQDYIRRRTKYIGR